MGAKLKNWEFVFKRRGWSLASYISGCKTIHDIHEKFYDAGMTTPSGGDLAAAGWGESPGFKSGVANDRRKKGQPSNKTASRSNKKETRGARESKYDEIVVIETE